MQSLLRRETVENIKVSVKGALLTIEIDTAKDLGLSKSGKTRLIASSQGNQKLNVQGKDVFLGINAYTK